MIKTWISSYFPTQKEFENFVVDQWIRGHLFTSRQSNHIYTIDLSSLILCVCSEE